MYIDQFFLCIPAGIKIAGTARSNSEIQNTRKEHVINAKNNQPPAPSPFSTVATEVNDIMSPIVKKKRSMPHVSRVSDRSKFVKWKIECNEAEPKNPITKTIRQFPKMFTGTTSAICMKEIL